MAETDLEALRDQADRGDADATDQLIELAGEQGNLDELRRLADQGHVTATDQLAELEGWAPLNERPAGGCSSA